MRASPTLVRAGVRQFSAESFRPSVPMPDGEYQLFAFGPGRRWRSSDHPKFPVRSCTSTSRDAQAVFEKALRGRSDVAAGTGHGGAAIAPVRAPGPPARRPRTPRRVLRSRQIPRNARSGRTPNAPIRCCFSSSKTLLMPATDLRSSPASTSRPPRLIAGLSCRLIAGFRCPPRLAARTRGGSKPWIARLGTVFTRNDHGDHNVVS